MRFNASPRYPSQGSDVSTQVQSHLNGGVIGDLLGQPISKLAERCHSRVLSAMIEGRAPRRIRCQSGRELIKRDRSVTLNGRISKCFLLLLPMEILGATPVVLLADGSSLPRSMHDRLCSTGDFGGAKAPRFLKANTAQLRQTRIVPSRPQ